VINKVANCLLWISGYLVWIYPPKRKWDNGRRREREKAVRKPEVAYNRGNGETRKKGSSK
jgi:hypothetical protein